MASTTSKPTFTLYRGWPTTNELIWSPFVTKVELRLRLANIPYTSAAGSTSQSPKGKIPYISVTNPSTNQTDTFSDSTLIIKHLVSEGHLPDLTTPLTPQQRLEDLAIRALLEDRLYFIHTRERWVDNYYAHRDHILSHLNTPMRAVVGLLIYRTVTATLHGQGTGRFSDEEIDATRCEIWNMIEQRLIAAKQTAQPDQPFWVLGGAQPTEADATLFGFVTSVLIATSCPRSQKVVRGLPAVTEYAERIYRIYFAEYRHWDG